MPKTARALLQLPPATAAAIEKLGADLAVARLRRKESLKTWAKRMGVSVPTLQRLEAGDPSVGIGIIATALWLLQRDGELRNLAAPEHDLGAIEMDVREAVELGRTRARASAEARVHQESGEGLSMRLDALYLWYLGDPARPCYVGALKLASAGKGVSLHCGKEWLDNGFALSEDLPLVDIEHMPPGRLAADAQRAVGAVDDARPDRWGEKVIRFMDKPKRLSLMEYLFYAGDDRFGALGVSTSSSTYSPRAVSPLPRLDDAQQLSEVVAKIEALEPITAQEAKIIAGGGGPLGGAKPKALIDIDGEQWIIKFFNNESVDTPLIEHATMTLAERAGITVSKTEVIHLIGANALAIRRFDREPGRRIHCISAGTAIRAATASGEEPELGYPALARILRRVGVTRDDMNQRDARELFRRMVFNILVDNTDDHEKNHSLLVVSPFENGRLKLAPAYDVVPTHSGQGYQEFICGVYGRDSTLDNAMSQCEAFGLLPAEAAAEVTRVIGVVNTWKEHFAQAGVTQHDIGSLAERIDGDGLLAQRTDFDQTRFQSAPARRKRPSPFRRT